MSTQRPRGPGWVKVEIFGGPKDGDCVWYRGASGYPFGTARFLDARHDPTQGVHPGDVLHVYEPELKVGKGEVLVYKGTEIHEEKRS